jgi:hypothetical protein
MIWASILPPNNLHLQDRPRGILNITEKQFNKITDDIVGVFAPIAKLHGANLVGVKNWSDSTVNAYADQSGSEWQVQMFGGLARRPEVTLDGFALVVCHEVGHHLAGFPFYSGFGEWAASEGQSDYFAAQVCARKIWAQDEKTNARFANIASETVRNSCDASWKSTRSRNLCYRIAMAGQSLALLLGALGNEEYPDFSHPDPVTVDQTVDYHPAAQCRLDTYFMGSVCNVNFDLTTIPGRDNEEGQNSAAAEQIAAFHSCAASEGTNFGARPRCWFKPELQAAAPLVSMLHP